MQPDQIPERTRPTEAEGVVTRRPYVCAQCGIITMRLQWWSRTDSFLCPDCTSVKARLARVDIRSKIWPGWGNETPAPGSRRSRYLRHLSDVYDATGPAIERERDIIRRRLDGETFESIGWAHGITRERVRQVWIRGVYRMLDRREREKNRQLRYSLSDRSAYLSAVSGAIRQGAPPPISVADTVARSW